jgi:HEPN domain-containing protein
MTKKIATKAVEKTACSNYLQKAEENLRSAQKAVEGRDYNSAAVCAVHSVISAADAYCVYGLGKRCSSSKHEDAAELIKTVPYPDAEKLAVSKTFLAVIRIKNMAEYEERLVKPKDAEKAVREAGEVLELIRNRLK